LELPACAGDEDLSLENPVQGGLEDLLGGDEDFLGDGDGGQVFWVNFVLAELEGDAGGIRESARRWFS